MSLRSLRNLSFAIFCAAYFSSGPLGANAAIEGNTCSYRCGTCVVLQVECDWCETGGEHGLCTSSGTGCEAICWSCDDEPLECMNVEA